MLVVGGGYIGLELGSVYAALGTKVTVVEMTPGLLPGADRDLVNILTKRMEQTLHKVLVNARVVEMKDAKGGIAVRIEGDAVPENERRRTFERVLVSVGRKPNSAVPGLDKTKVAVGDRGFITVDRHAARASHDLRHGGIVGSRCSRQASHEARVAVEAILGQNVAFGHRRFRPWCSRIGSGVVRTRRPRRRNGAARSRSPASRGRLPAARSPSTPSRA
jgi:dihydrolipoamide dehydrogenase